MYKLFDPSFFLPNQLQVAAHNFNEPILWHAANAVIVGRKFFRLNLVSAKCLDGQI